MPRSTRTTTAPHGPAEPRLTATTPATEPVLDHEATFQRLAFADVDLTGHDADLVEFDQCRFQRTTLAGATLDSSRFTDCEAEQSDWANARLTKPTLLRTKLTSVRLTGTQWTAGAFRDVTVEACRADLAAFRFSSFTHVAFVDCNLAGADFTSADLRGASFTGCDLSGAQFSSARCAGARFTACDLAGLGGVTSLEGATIAARDLVALTYALGRALGITIEES